MKIRIYQRTDITTNTTVFVAKRRVFGLFWIYIHENSGRLRRIDRDELINAIRCGFGLQYQYTFIEEIKL